MGTIRKQPFIKIICGNIVSLSLVFLLFAVGPGDVIAEEGTGPYLVMIGAPKGGHRTLPGNDWSTQGWKDVQWQIHLEELRCTNDKRYEGLAKGDRQGFRGKITTWI